MRWVAAFLLLALVLMVPGATASSLSTLQSVGVGATTALVELDNQFTGQDAMTLRGIIDECGTKDGTVTEQEVTSYQERINVRDPIAAPNDFDLVLLDGKGPARIASTIFRIDGAAGESGSPNSIVVHVARTYEFDDVSASPKAAVDFSEVTEAAAEIDTKCGSGITGSVSSCLQDCPAARPVLMFRPATPLTFDRSSLQPSTFDALWDGAGLRADTDAERSQLRSESVEVQLQNPAAPIDPGASSESSSSPFTRFAWAGLAFVGVAGILSVESIRYPLLSRFLGFGLFSRFEKDEVLEHESRDELYTFIKTNPGQSLADLRRTTGLPHGTTIHHLRILESKGFIKAVRDGFRTRFYLSGPRIEPEPYMTHVQMTVIETIRARPGLTQKELASALELPRESVAYHVRRLEALGRIEVQSHGRWRRYFPRMSQGPPAAEMAAA